MKYILITTTIIIVIILSSCTKYDDDSIVGNWEWVESSGGISGESITPKTVGREIRLEISSTSIKEYWDDNFISEKSYSIQKAESIRGGQEQMIIDENGFKQSFERSRSWLFLYDECFDCYSSEYKKIKN